MHSFPKIIVICAVVFTCCYAFTCKRETNYETVRGKLIYRSCATVAVQVLDTNYYNLGQPEWMQSPGTPLFKNVFSVTNICEFPIMDSGTVFKFRVISTGRKDCVICMMFDNPPQQKQMIEVMKD